MSYMMKADVASLRRYESALETFKNQIQKKCSALESDIAAYGKFMQDEKSQKALQDAKTACEDVKNCLTDVDATLATVRDLIIDISNA